MAALTRFNLLVIYYLQRSRESASPSRLSLVLLKMTSDYAKIHNEIYLPQKWTRGKFGWFCKEIETSIEKMYKDGLLLSHSIPDSKYFTYSLSPGIPQIEMPLDWRQIVMETVEYTKGRRDIKQLQMGMKDYAVHSSYDRFPRVEKEKE